MKSFLKNPFFSLARAFVIVLGLAAVFAPLLANNRPYLYIDKAGSIAYPLFSNDAKWRGVDFKALARQADVTVWLPPIPFAPNEYNLDEGLLPPQGTHLLGTDEQGRDVAARLIHGCRVSLLVGVVAVGLSALIGILVGALAGYHGGKTDFLLSRLIEVMICFPTFFLILAVLAVWRAPEKGLWPVMIVIGLTGWTGTARLIRGELLQRKTEPFVLAARHLGFSSWRILFRHLLPLSLPSLRVLVIFGIGAAILTESALSFLGFGVPPSVATWGGLLRESREFADFAWWLALFPGLMIFLTILSFNVCADHLRKSDT